MERTMEDTSIKDTDREEPKKRKVILDTDTYNEIDDQFALAYLLRSKEELDVQAVYAAPFFNHHSVSPADGMEKSYEEILKILELTHEEDLKGCVQKGSTHYLEDEKTPVSSPAALDLVRRAKEAAPADPLYVVAIGAITNVASAILLAPEIIARIHVVWLGGNAVSWPDNREFNSSQDIAAARVVYKSGVAMTILPCMGVVSEFRTTGPELKAWLLGKNELCDYLVENTIREASQVEQEACWSRPIWDVTAVAWLMNKNFMLERRLPRPIPGYDNRYSDTEKGTEYTYVYHINRDTLFADLFGKLGGVPVSKE